MFLLRAKEISPFCCSWRSFFLPDDQDQLICTVAGSIVRNANFVYNGTEITDNSWHFYKILWPTTVKMKILDIDNAGLLNYKTRKKIHSNEHISDTCLLLCLEGRKVCNRLNFCFQFTLMHLWELRTFWFDGWRLGFHGKKEENEIVKDWFFLS